MTDFRKILISDFMKISMVGLELPHIYQQRDMTKLMDAFRSFANTHKKTQCCL